MSPLRTIQVAASLAVLAGTLAVVPAARAEHDRRAISPRLDTERRLERLSIEVREYREATGELPPSREGVEGIASDPSLLEDAWGRPLLYLRIAGGFWLTSWGADGAPGGEGDDADVVHIAR